MKKLFTLALLLAAPAFAQPLTTLAERTGFKQTGRYAEVEQLAKAFAAQYPQAVRVETFGTTPEGRPMLAIVATRAWAGGSLEGGRRSPPLRPIVGAPVVLIQGGIHAGEIDGKDAGFLALRELLEDPKGLQSVVLVFVPVFNVDGHERFGKWNRPNQVGPEETGWRVTSQNLNLNRDYCKADTPEMRAMLGLLNKWDPILYVDLHVTDGAQFQADVSNLVEPVFIGDAELQPLGKALQKETNQRSNALALDFYPSLRDGNDPASGFSDSAYTSRFSTGYWALRNRFAMLVETHSWKEYARRVRVTHDIFRAVVDLTARDGPKWLAAAHRADQRALQGLLTLTYKTTDRHTTIDFPGYAYKREHSDVSGGTALRYDPSKPEVWHVPYYNEVVPNIVVNATTGGYLVPAVLAPLLQLHGVQFRKLTAAWSGTAEAFRAEQVTFSGRPSEGHQTAAFTGHWAPETQSVPIGVLYVPFHQPGARLIAALLEPLCPDSLAAWGFFNAYFEQKEYMEDYVTEQVAVEMLAASPALKAEFEQKLASDSKFAASPEARLDFFYRRHPSHDARRNLYPVLRVRQDP